jgi:hypothetical protein
MHMISLVVMLLPAGVEEELEAAAWALWDIV